MTATVIDDDMVERTALAMHARDWHAGWGSVPHETRETYRVSARMVLEAAIGPTTPGAPHEQRAAVKMILDERAAQDRKFGEQNYDPEMWVMIIGEEFGEMAREALTQIVYGRKGASAAYVGELCQLAAVAMNALECAVRNGAGEGKS